MSEQAQVIYLFVCVHCSAKLLVRFFICHSKHTQYEALGLDFFMALKDTWHQALTLDLL
jgi:hypothetical protein